MDTAVKCPACGRGLHADTAADGEGLLTTPVAWALLAGGPLLVFVGVVGLLVGGWSTAAGSVGSLILGGVLTYVGVRARRR